MLLIITGFLMDYFMNFDPFTPLAATEQMRTKLSKLSDFGIAFCDARPHLFMLRSRLNGHIVGYSLVNMIS